jgi:O-antigen ligase
MPLSQVALSRRSIGTWARTILIGVLAGVVVAWATPAMSSLHRRFIALGVLSLVMLTVVFATGRAREAFLFAWVVSLTYNRQFWSFAPIVGDHGAFGPYWMISDLLLLVLIAQWIYGAAILKRPQRASSWSPLRWYVPFAIVAALSVVGTREPVWALGDLIRVAKLGLVLVYVSYNVGPREWWLVIAGLGAAISLQSILGILTVATGRLGVLSIIGLGASGEAAAFGIHEIYPEGFRRAHGTLAHAPYLGAFFVLTVPVFMSLALTLRKGPGRWTCVCVAGLGLVGLAFTLARTAILVMMGQAVLLIMALIGMRLISVGKAIAVSAFAGLLVGIVGVVTADSAYERVTRNIDTDFSERISEYHVAEKMLLDHPLLGVGLNNYGAYMREYGSSSVWGLERRWHDASIQMTHMRLLAGPLNGFLYVATVTGLLGLAAFLWLAFGALRLSWVAVKSSTGPVRAACLGTAVGILGLYLVQATEYSIWIDTLISVWLVLIGLVGCVASGALQAPEARGERAVGL